MPDPARHHRPELQWVGKLAQPFCDCCYRNIGLRHWLLAEAGAYDRIGRILADDHYSRRQRGSPQFMTPGQRFVLVTPDFQSVFGWWRPHPASGIIALNGLDGWTCTIFRRTGGTVLASELILDAERAIAALGYRCGPDGLLTYVWDAKVQSGNKGYCFKRAGWHRAGGCADCRSVGARSADGRKTLLHKPFRDTRRTSTGANF